VNLETFSQIMGGLIMELTIVQLGGSDKPGKKSFKASDGNWYNGTIEGQYSLGGDDLETLKAAQPGDIVQLEAKDRPWSFNGKNGIAHDITAIQKTGTGAIPQQAARTGGGFKGKSPEQERINNRYMAYENGATAAANVISAAIHAGMSIELSAEAVIKLQSVIAMNTIKGAES
jgi:hypothetical protein